MPDDPTPPPLVIPVAPPAPPRPRPGFWEAVAWCLLFVLVLLIAVLATACGILGGYALGRDDPGQFLIDQLTGFASSFQHAGPDQPPRPPPPREIAAALAYGMLVSQLASFGLALLVVRRRVGPDWRRQLGVRTPAAMHVLLVVLMVPGFLVLSEGIQELFLYLTGMKPTAPEGALRGLFAPVPWFVSLLAVAVGPGVVEELWCRGFLGRGLTARYGLPAGVLATSVLFAAMHGEPSRLLVYTVMGAFLHFVYVASRSLWVPVILHLLNNGTAVLLELSPVLNRAAKAFEEDARGVRAVTDIAALGLLIFASVALWTSRPVVTPAGGGKGAGWKPEYPAVSLPPAGVPAKVGYGAISPAAVVLALASFGVLIFLLGKHAP